VLPPPIIFLSSFPLNLPGLPTPFSRLTIKRIGYRTLAGKGSHWTIDASLDQIGIRASRLTSKSLERVMRIELTYGLRLPVWKTGALPMDHTRANLERPSRFELEPKPWQGPMLTVKHHERVIFFLYAILKCY
jgi:hypothetical protein